MRLARLLAVTHMEPEVLIIDEVLAVGDAEFQAKCLGRMKQVSAGGKTVVFVSHNLDAIARICDRAVLLAQGMVQELGDSASIVSRYHGIGHKSLHPCSFRMGDANLVANLVLDKLVTSTPQLTFSLTLTCDSTIRINELALILETTNGQRVGLIDFRTCLLKNNMEGPSTTNSS